MISAPSWPPFLVLYEQGKLRQEAGDWFPSRWTKRRKLRHMASIGGEEVCRGSLTWLAAREFSSRPEYVLTYLKVVGPYCHPLIFNGNIGRPWKSSWFRRCEVAMFPLLGLKTESSMTTVVAASAPRWLGLEISE